LCEGEDMNGCLVISFWVKKTLPFGLQCEQYVATLCVYICLLKSGQMIYALATLACRRRWQCE
jgi:hypothetical protein